MKFFTGRCTGKTTKIIKLCNEQGGYIVCRDRMVKAIHKQAIEMGCNIPYPLSYQEFIDRRYCGNGVKQVFIDDVDALIAYMSDVPIAYATISNFEEIPIDNEQVNSSKKQ